VSAGGMSAKHRRGRAIAAAVLLGAMVAACAPSSERQQLLIDIRDEVGALAPTGWSPVASDVVFRCASLDLLCTDVSSGGAFRSDDGPTVACMSTVDWALESFDGVAGVSGTGAEGAPSAQACAAELDQRGRYRMTAPSDLSPEATWAMTLIRVGDGVRLEVVLGAPPDPGLLDGS